MATIWLVRHGEVAGNDPRTRAFAGWHDLPLTPRGVTQTHMVAERLARESIAEIWSSDLQRAARTADAIASHHNLTPRLETGLREVNYGAWEGMGDEELLREWGELWRAREADPVSVSPPGGESYAALWEREAPVWEQIVGRALELHASAPSSALVVAGHNGSLRAILCDVLGVPLQNARRMQLSNCGLSRIEVKPGEGEANALSQEPLEPRLLVRAINETGHLEGLEGRIS